MNQDLSVDRLAEGTPLCGNVNKRITVAQTCEGERFGLVPDISYRTYHRRGRKRFSCGSDHDGKTADEEIATAAPFKATHALSPAGRVRWHR
jgi:hypothetical protein